jgi:hypothetical protein
MIAVLMSGSALDAVFSPEASCCGGMFCTCESVGFSGIHYPVIYPSNYTISGCDRGSGEI